MTDRELLEALVKKVSANEAQISNIESKIDKFVKQYNDVLYGYARNDKYASK